MSRAVLAYAREARLAADTTTAFRTTGGVRLLGDRNARPLDLQLAPRASEYDGSARRLAAARNHALVWNQMAFEPYYSAANVQRRERHARAKHPGWLLGTIFGMVALIAVVSPVLAGSASNISGKGLRLSMKDYQAAVHSSSAPVIDVANGQEAPTEPTPAPATGAPGSDHSVLGPPSLSVAQIESVLSQYGSPAVGRGQALFDLGVKYGIDPAYALAFFVHESACGTKGVARFSRSLGNIRWTPGYESYEGYRAYTSWEAGFEDWYLLITDLYIGGWGLRTVDDIIPVYAPYGDNNHPPTYIASVKALVDSWRGK